jgi:DNA-binding transcriptional ArsR family regulator
MTMNRWGESPTPREGDLATRRLAQLLHSLAEPARLSIVRHLALGEHRVVDLTEHLGLAQSTTSAHLAVLRDAGIVTVRADGRSSLYGLAAPAELDALLEAAELLGAAVSAAPSGVPR